MAPTARERRIRIAKVDLMLRSADDSIMDWVDFFFREYTPPGNGSTCDACIDLVPGPDSLGTDIDDEFHALPRGGARQRDFIIELTGPAHYRAQLSRETSDALCNTLRWLLPPLLIRNGALLLHAACVVKGGEAYVLFGKSGAGKSTSSRLIADSDPQATLLGDDAVIISSGAAGPLAHAAPLGCGYAQVPPPPTALPLKGLYALMQSSRHDVHACNTSTGVSKLIANAMLPSGLDVETLLATAIPFATMGPGINTLEFTKDPGFWTMIHSHAQGAVWTKKQSPPTSAPLTKSPRFTQKSSPL